MIKTQEILKYIKLIIRTFLFLLFTVSHLELIQGRSTKGGELRGLGNIAYN